MKAIQGSVFRAIVAIVVGALLIKYRLDTLHWLTVAIGGLFALSGAVSCLAYWRERRRALKAMAQYVDDGTMAKPHVPFVPIVGVGSLILGVILACMADTFISGVATVLSVILILGAINQLISLVQGYRYSRIPLLYWLFPLLTLLVGVFVLVKPMESMATPLLIIGWCMIFYGVVELLNALKLRQARRAFEKNEEERIRETMQKTAEEAEATIIEE